MFRIECPECQGQGDVCYEVGRPDYIHGGELVEMWAECEKCFGSGEIEVEIEDLCQEFSEGMANGVWYSRAKFESFDALEQFFLAHLWGKKGIRSKVIGTVLLWTEEK